MGRDNPTREKSYRKEEERMTLPNYTPPEPKTPWYKRPWAFIAAGLLLFVAGSALDGDGTAVDAPIPPPTVTSSTGYTTSSSTTSTIEEVAATTSYGMTADQLDEFYVEFLREWSADQSQVTIMDLSTDAELIDLAHIVCDDYRAGRTSDDLFYDILAVFGDDPDFDDRAVEFGTLIGAATAAYCPEHGED